MNALQLLGSRVALAGLLTTTSIAGDVLEVGPQRSFVTIEAAVSAATSGDIVLIDPGTYVGDLDIDFGVTLVARTTAFTINGYLEIGPLPGSQAVLISGGVVEPSLGTDGLRPVIDIDSCRGAVRIQDCAVRGFPLGEFEDGGPALRCNRSNHVVCSSSSFAGITGVAATSVPALGGFGIEILSRSDVELDRCTILGGEGSFHFFIGGPGGAGVSVSGGGRLLSYGSSISGGEGGEGLGLIGGVGGAGLITDASSSSAILQQTTLVGGVGGRGSFGIPASSGATYEGAAPVLLDGAPRSFTAPAIVRATDPGWTLVTHRLVAGETAATWLSPRTAPRYATVFERTLRVRASAPDTINLDPVTANTSGEVAAAFGPTMPPAGEDGLVIWAQSFCVAPNGSRRFSGSRATVLLDAAFSGL